MGYGRSNYSFNGVCLPALAFPEGTLVLLLFMSLAKLSITLQKALITISAALPTLDQFFVDFAATDAIKSGKHVSFYAVARNSYFSVFHADLGSMPFVFPEVMFSSQSLGSLPKSSPFTTFLPEHLGITIRKIWKAMKKRKRTTITQLIWCCFQPTSWS